MRFASFSMSRVVEVPAPRAPALSSGPAQVATETYRKNWDAIYGRNKKPLLN